MSTFNKDPFPLLHIGRFAAKPLLTSLPSIQDTSYVQNIAVITNNTSPLHMTCEGKQSLPNKPLQLQTVGRFAAKISYTPRLP